MLATGTCGNSICMFVSKAVRVTASCIPPFFGIVGPDGSYELCCKCFATRNYYPGREGRYACKRRD